MGASKVNEETVLNSRTKIMPAAARKMEEEEDKTLVKKVVPLISLKLMQAFPVLIEEVPVLDLDKTVVVDGERLQYLNTVPTTTSAKQEIEKA